MSTWLELLLLFATGLAAGIVGIVLFVGGIVNKMQKRLIAGSILMAISLICVILLFTVFIRMYFQFVGEVMKINIRSQYQLKDEVHPQKIQWGDTELFRFYPTQPFECEHEPILFYCDKQLHDAGFTIKNFECSENKDISFQMHSKNFVSGLIEISFTDVNDIPFAQITEQYLSNLHNATNVHITHDQIKAEKMQKIFFRLTPNE